MELILSFSVALVHWFVQCVEVHVVQKDARGEISQYRHSIGPKIGRRTGLLHVHPLNKTNYLGSNQTQTVLPIITPNLQLLSPPLPPPFLHHRLYVPCVLCLQKLQPRITSSISD